jgi:hypothetical protein
MSALPAGTLSFEEAVAMFLEYLKGYRSYVTHTTPARMVLICSFSVARAMGVSLGSRVRAR